MMAQVTAAALVGENRVLSHPASPGSITTSGNKEDFVSMGMTAALKLRDVVRNTRTVLAIETLAAARALDFLRPLRSSGIIEGARELIPRIEGDQPLSGEIAKVDDLIARGLLRAS
jgi:histidine ammonia-lyase